MIAASCGRNCCATTTRKIGGCYAAVVAADAWLASITFHCVMTKYAKYIGDWHPYWQNYTWQSLPGGDHTALGDCRATLALLRSMASSDLPAEPARDAEEKEHR